MILLQKFCIIGFDLIKCGDRVVSQHAIFRHQSGAQSIRILVKQAVVTYAKADNYVELGFFGVQKFCLKDRIAHIHTDIFAGGVVSLLVTYGLALKLRVPESAMLSGIIGKVAGKLKR